jgi:hypothetical protein
LTQRGGLTVGGDVVEATLVRKVECVSRKAEGPEAKANARWWQFPVETAPHYVRYPFPTRPLLVTCEASNRYKDIEGNSMSRLKAH